MRVWQRISPQAAPVRQGEFTQPVWETPAPTAPVAFPLCPRQHRETCLWAGLKHDSGLCKRSAPQAVCSSSPSPGTLPAPQPGQADSSLGSYPSSSECQLESTLTTH